jgi:NADH dehydrogenase
VRSIDVSIFSEERPHSLMRRIVIVGSGFGGFEAARTLQHQLQGRRHLEIVLASPAAHFVYTPLLPHVASGQLPPTASTVSLQRTFGDRIHLRRTRIRSITPDRGRLETDEGSMAFDYLLLAPGMATDWGGHPEWAEHTFSFGTPSDAVRIRDAVGNALERARHVRDERRLREMLTFAVVGAGPAGIELIAELADALRRTDAPSLPARLKSHLRCVVLERRDSLLPELPTPVARAARDALESLGVEIHTNTEVTDCNEEGVRLDEGSTLRTDHVVWCGGLRTRACLRESGLPLDRRGRVVVDSTLQVADYPGIYAVGDAAAPQLDLPRTAQIASSQGETAAANLAALLDGRSPVTWAYEENGWMLTLGGRRAVAHVGGETWSGPPAWGLYRATHASMMPGALKKASLVGSWLAGTFGTPSFSVE